VSDQMTDHTTMEQGTDGGGITQSRSFQSRVDDWLLACFGEQVARDKTERNHRLLEEALETVQACDCTAEDAHQLVDYTFGRPKGEPKQEVGGLALTVAALCLAQGIDMEAAAETELARVWTAIDRIREKQRTKPRHSPLPGSLEEATALCMCKDRPADKCPGEWEPGCDLGANEKLARRHEPPPTILDETPVVKELHEALRALEADLVWKIKQVPDTFSRVRNAAAALSATVPTVGELSEPARATNASLLALPAVDAEGWNAGGNAPASGYYWTLYPGQGPTIKQRYEGYVFAGSTRWQGPLKHPPVPVVSEIHG